MDTKEIKVLLQQFFDGETTEQDEKILYGYFRSGEVADELKHYTTFFGGISELAARNGEHRIEEEIMDKILENENREKTTYRRMWRMVTGIAASIIIVLGSFLIYEQQQKPFRDTFDDPDQAYAYATQTLQYVSSKYNKGLAALSEFEKLQEGTTDLKKGIEPVNTFFEGIGKKITEPASSEPVE